MNALKIDNLNYGEIIKDLNLELSTNSFNIVVGKNSSGKTTLVNSILGINKYGGKIDLFVSNNEIGVVTEKNKLINDTVLYNLMYPLVNLDYPEAKAKKTAYNFSKQFGVDSILFKNVNEIGASDYKLIQIILSFIHSPKLVIIDDSLDDLYYHIKKNILSYLKKISKTTCILILTSNTDYLSYADQIFLLNDGRIIDSFTYKEIQKKDKLFNKMNINLPFMDELTLKLKFYGIIDENYNNIEELVKDIWK